MQSPSDPLSSPRTPARLIEDALDAVASTMGYELLLVELSGAGKHRRIIVYLDRVAAADASGPGISLDDCAKMSPILSSTLDAAEADPSQEELAGVLSAPYVLEVSSPGVDRPLSRLSHFRKQLGRLAKVSTFAPLVIDSRQRNFTGRIRAVQSDPNEPTNDKVGTIVIEDPAHGEPGADAQTTIPLAAIRRANLVYEG